MKGTYDELVKKLADSERMISYERDNVKAAQDKHDKLLKEHNEFAQRLQDEFELKEKKLVFALEAKLEKELLEKEKEYNRKEMEFTKKGTEENYAKLSESLTKLHEEGNAQTKFVQDLAIKVAGGR